MLIRLWTDFSKRKNSTKRPSTSAADMVEMHVAFKEDTSLENPVFIIDEPYPQYTYVQAFSDYYFVTDIVNLDNYRSEIHCTMDVLATFRTEIFNYTAFVERSASEYDEFINDPLLTGRQIIRDESVTRTQLNVFGSGCYISEVMTADSGMTLYVTPDLRPFRQLLMPSTYKASDIRDWVDSKVAQAFDLDVYIGTIKWVPFDTTDIGGNPSNDFYVGPVDVGVPVDYIIRKARNNATVRSTVVVNLSDQGLFGDWRDCNPKFTQYNIQLPGVGVADLDPAVIGSCIHQNRELHLDIDIDLVSGDVVYTLRVGNTRTNFARYKGNVSVNIPIGKSVSDMSNTISMVAGGAGAAAQGYAMGGVAGAAIAGGIALVNVIDNIITPQTSMIGGSGNKADLYATRSSIEVTRRQYGTKTYPLAVAGRPLCQNRQLSTLTGFCKCGNASVPLNARDSERDQVNNYLNSGFYIE